MKTLKIQKSKISLPVLITYLLNLFLCTVNAQSGQQTPVNPVMKISNLNRNTENPMRLDVLRIDIKVFGQIAVTTLDMTYYNGNSRIMEGDFNFPLGEGQTVSRFALDMNGALREGVVVEKEQGRKTFEAIVRRGVDPGLLEMTGGNNFRMRIYPLPAKGTRRIVLAFEQELTDKGNYDLYLLPLKITESVKKFSVHAEIVRNQVNLDTERNEFGNLSFEKWEDSYVANFTQDNYTPDKQIALNFPHVNDSERVFTAPSVNPGSSYFYVNIRPPLSEERKSLPGRITLLWDNSGSARNRDIEKELSLLDAYIQEIKKLSIELVPFNIQTGKPETFEIANGKWDMLKTALKTMIYDGATSLGSLDFNRFTGNEILLFTDGMTNFGNTEPLFSKIPVITVNSNLAADHAFLTYIAQRTGGEYINLTRLSKDEAAVLLTHNNFHFISARTENGRVSDMYPSTPCQLSNSFSLTGIMEGKTAVLVLEFGFRTTVTYSKRIMITADDPVEATLLRRLWAEKKIAELSLNSGKNKDEITLTGKEYGIVTPNTSLIVLENLNDYLQYNIVPPAEMRQEYFRQKSASEKEALEKSQEHMDHVVALSDEQSKWWNTYFPVPGTTSPGKTREMVAPRIAANRAERLGDQAFLMVEEMPTFPAEAPDTVRLASASRAVMQISADIQINAWDPQTPYLKVLQYAHSGEEYGTYLKLREEYESTPSFYMDASDFFAKLGKRDIAVTVLSNLAELRIESPELLRILGNKLLDLNSKSDAVMIFEKVLSLKAEEPQSYRDLGLAFKADGNFQKAITVLYEVVKKEWDSRFPDIEIIVMNEINAIIASHPGLDYSFIDRRLIKKEPVDIRVVLTWETDNSDIDLWVTDPSGEKCFYENKLTRLGGRLSDDFVNGYGPEEFMIKKAISGEYSVQANYYGTRSQTILAPVSLHLVFITDFGKPGQKEKEVTIRLEDKNDIVDVGKFSFKAN